MSKLEEYQKNNKNFICKEMVYELRIGNRKELLCEGIYKGYQFYIFSLGIYPVAYVVIPKKNKLFKKSHLLSLLNVHGGITYCEDNLKDIIEDSLVIGWDYGHYGDYLPILSSLRGQKRWATEEIFEEVINVIEQIEEMNAEM